MPTVNTGQGLTTGLGQMVECKLTDRIFLMGFMAAGKSTIAPLVARKLGVGWTDTDELIVELGGMSIPNIFDALGEECFRELERRAVREAIKSQAVVVSLGGGAPLDEDNWQLISGEGQTFYLRVSPEVIFRRVEQDCTKRPLLANLGVEGKRKKIKKILNRREPRYRQADYIVDCSNLSPKEIATKIAEKYGGVD